MSQKNDFKSVELIKDLLLEYKAGLKFNCYTTYADELISSNWAKEIPYDSTLNIYSAKKLQLDVLRNQIIEAKKLNKKSLDKIPFALSPEKKEIYLTKLKSSDLLSDIHSLLDSRHKEDHLEKLTTFIACCTSELPNPSDRISIALKGDSSAGKDNNIKANFSLFPDEDSFFLTRGTQSALEEEAQKVKRVAFSEINANREGANSDLTEFYKQLSEGGINVIKRDKETNKVIHLKTEQKSLFYSTTETARDEELATRHLVIGITSDANKNLTVVSDYCKSVSNAESYEAKHSTPWFKEAVESGLLESLDVLLPFASSLYSEVTIDGNKKYLFDMNKDRIKRDVKRIIALCKGVAWLHQHQRIIITKDSTRYILAEPIDFLTVLLISGTFFAQTYEGLDPRIAKTLENIKKLEGKCSEEVSKFGYSVDTIENYGSYVPRHILQEECKIPSITTIKSHINQLSELRLIEKVWNGGNSAVLVKSRYQLRYHLGIGGYQPDTFKHLIDTLFDTLSDEEKLQNKDYWSKSLCNWSEFSKKEGTLFVKMTPSELIPSFSTNIHPPKNAEKSQKNVLQALTNSAKSTQEISEIISEDLQSTKKRLEKLSFEGLANEIKPNFWISVSNSPVPHTFSDINRNEEIGGLHSEETDENVEPL